MKNYIIAGLLIIINHPYLYSQKIDEQTMQQIEFAEGFLYEMGKTLKEKPLYYHKKPVEVKPWENLPYQRKELLTTLDTIIKNARIDIDEDGYYLSLESEFKQNVETNDLLKIDITDNQLTNADGEPVDLEHDSYISYGMMSTTTYRNGEQVEDKTTSLSASFQVNNHAKNARGKLNLNASLVNDYEVIKISKQDKGKEFQFNQTTYKVLDIKNNLIVLEPKEYIEGQTMNFQFLNLDDSEANEYAQVSMMELSERKEKGEDIDLETASGISQSTMPQKVYELFQENPEISMKNFKKVIHPIMLSAAQSGNIQQALQHELGKNYIIIESCGPIENCYLYKEKYGLSREFEIEL